MIKGIDPGAKIVLAGLFAAPKEATYRSKPPQAYFATDFIEQLYKRTPGIKSKFDGVALHPYTYDYQDITGHVEELRDVLKAAHDPGVGLWITELGWSAGRPNASNGFNGFEKGPSGQAKQLKGVLPAAQGETEEMAPQADLLVLRRRQTGRLQLLRRLRPLRPRLRRPAVLEGLREVRRRHGRLAAPREAAERGGPRLPSPRIDGLALRARAERLCAAMPR